jgi:hydroxysqualene dehydroxylase
VDRHANALAAALKTVAVIGGGWAGLAAAVRATQAGALVTLFEMAPQLGGRAREVAQDGQRLDNGQHILIGAYTHCLALMRTVGLDTSALHRCPLALSYPDGRGLTLPAGPATVAFLRGVLRARGWDVRDKASLLTTAARWWAGGFRADAQATVAELSRSLRPAVRELLIEPLCVAALNTPASDASAQVFLRVMKDALFSGPGSADLVLPRRSLSALWPEPAQQWLQAQGATLRLMRRVQRLVLLDGGCEVDGERFDAVVLAASANEAARLAADIAPAWSARAAAFEYEPIVTVYLRSPGSRLPLPMMALRTDAQSPAQFVFDLGALDTEREGLFALVVSGAREWMQRGLQATEDAALQQAVRDLGAHWRQAPEPVRTLCEKRATFRCVPGLDRPPVRIATQLVAVGDYVEGPYPATLEGAVRSVVPALAALGL